MPSSRISRRLLKGRIFTLKERIAPPPVPFGWDRDPVSGLFLRRSDNHNMVVNAGLSALFKWIQYGHASQGGSIRYMAVGTGTTAPAKTDTTLVTELTRVAISSWDNTDIDSDPIIMIASYLFGTSEANATLAEAGLFQNSSGAPMTCRGLFGLGTISNATQASPCVITAPSHNLSAGDLILIENVSGMTELNDNQYYINVLDANSFALYTDEGLTTAVNSSGYGAYTTASPDLDTWKLLIPKTSDETLTVNYQLSVSAD